MSDHDVQNYHDGDAKSTESMHSHQSLWMGRWMRTSGNSASQVHNQFSLLDKSSEKDDLEQGPMVVKNAEPSKHKRLDINAHPCNISEYRNSCGFRQWDIGVASNVPQSSKEAGAVTEVKRVEITHKIPMINSRNLKNSRSELQPIPLLSFSEKVDSIFSQKKSLSICNKHESKAQTDDNSKHGKNTIERSEPHFLSGVLGLTSTETAFPLEEYSSQSEGNSQCRRQLIKPYRSLDKKSLPVFKPFQDKLTRSTSNSVPFGFKSQGTAVQSFICRQEEPDLSSYQVASKEYFGSTNFTHVEHEKSNYHSYSSFLVCDKKMDNHLVSMNSENSYSGQKDGALQLNDPSPSNFCFPVSVGEPGNRMHGFTISGLLPSQSCPGPVKRLEQFNSGCQSSSGVPRPVHHIEKLGIFSGVGSLDGVSKGPNFSQTTNHLSTADVPKGNQMLRESTISTEFKGSVSPGLYTLLPDFDCHANCREKLRPLGSSSNSEGKKPVKDVRTGLLGLKNESSAETDTMDINVCQPWNPLPCITSSPSNKDTMVRQNPAIYQSKISLLRDKCRSRMTEIELPDMNREPAEKSTGNMDLSTSKTESLDMECLFHDDQAGNSSSSLQQYSTLGPDPGSRWVKRLKLSASDYHGSKNVKIRDSLTTEKVHKLYNKITECSGTSSGPSFSEFLGKVGQMELDKTILVLGNKDPSSSDSVKERRDVNLSHPWIKRWCCNRASTPQMKSVASVACELESSKVALDEYQTKQFPSIGAMALMGKTMSGLQACEFQNKGSFVAWSTGRF